MDNVERNPSALPCYLGWVLCVALVLATLWNAMAAFIGAQPLMPGPVAFCDPEAPAWLCLLYHWAMWVQP